jgi:DNA repair exonuclease SbcCD ATPase subunit
MELKKRHDLMRKRLEKSVKDKQESVSQLKSLFGLFTQQRKALEVSIQKTKRLEDENVKLQERNK